MFFKLSDKLMPAMTGTFSGQLRNRPRLWPSAGVGGDFLISAAPQEALHFSAKDAQALGPIPDRTITSTRLGSLKLWRSASFVITDSSSPVLPTSFPGIAESFDKFFFFLMLFLSVLTILTCCIPSGLLPLRLFDYLRFHWPEIPCAWCWVSS